MQAEPSLVRARSSAQQLLPLEWSAQHSLDEFALDADGHNAAALRAVQQLIAHEGHDALYLWGDGGSGKSHLLWAAGHALQALGRRVVLLSSDLPPGRWPDVADFAAMPAGTMLALDDVQALAPWQQEQAFGLFNAARAGGMPVLAAGDAAPAALPVLPDLRTRLGWGLALRLATPDDALRAQVLQRQAQRRGYRLPPELLAYMLTHLSRDPRVLSRLMNAFDRYALATKRAATIPLLKALLEEQPELLQPIAADSAA